MPRLSAPFTVRGLEDLLGGPAVLIARKRLEDLVRVSRECGSHPSRGLVVPEVDGLAVPVVRRPGIPRAEESVLEHRELVRVVSEVVQHLLDEARGHARAGDPDGLLDGLATLIAGQPRDQVLSAVHRLGEPGDVRAVAQVVRAHRDRDVDTPFGSLTRREEEAHERSRGLFRARPLLPEPEDLLELVDDDEQVRRRIEGCRLPHGLDEAEVAPGERGPETRQGFRVLGVVEVRIEEPPGRGS